MQGFETIAPGMLMALEADNAAREEALTRCRQLVRTSARAIYAIHRGEAEAARKLLDEGAEMLAALREALKGHPALYHTGYVHSAQKEYAEAQATYALVENRPLPGPGQLGVEVPAYLNGLGEAAGELRRQVLDMIRQNRLNRAEVMLLRMEEIHRVLTLFDFPDALTRGLRRTNDMVRGVLERTRGDLTMALRQKELEQALRGLEERLDRASS